MKSIQHLSLVALLIAGLLSTAPALAEENMPQGHGAMTMTKAGPKGQQIRETKMDGYTLTYRLIDMKALMPDMAGMDGTYHLMVFFKDPKGTVVKKAMVGYLVEGPDGNVQKTMAMGMGDGFGANIRLPVSGTYTIKAKALIGGKKLIDSFQYDKSKMQP
jgi:hypothetical protein